LPASLPAPKPRADDRQLKRCFNPFLLLHTVNGREKGPEEKKKKKKEKKKQRASPFDVPLAHFPCPVISAEKGKEREKKGHSIPLWLACMHRTNSMRRRRLTRQRARPLEKGHARRIVHEGGRKKKRKNKLLGRPAAAAAGLSVHHGRTSSRPAPSAAARLRRSFVSQLSRKEIMRCCNPQRGAA